MDSSFPLDLRLPVCGLTKERVYVNKMIETSQLILDWN